MRRAAGWIRGVTGDIKARDGGDEYGRSKAWEGKESRRKIEAGILYNHEIGYQKLDMVSLARIPSSSLSTMIFVQRLSSGIYSWSTSRRESRRNLSY